MWLWGLLDTTGFQNIILIVTTCFAIYIGLKQNEINKNLLDLNYYPEVELTYDEKSRHVVVYNHGKAGFSIYGVGPIPPDPHVPVQPSYVSPGSSWPVPEGESSRFSNHCIKETMPLALYVFLETENRKRHTVKALFFCEGTKIYDKGQVVGAATDWRTF